MLSPSLSQVSSSAVFVPAAAKTGQLAAASVVHWMLVCFQLFFFTSTRVPQLAQACGRSPPVRNSLRSVVVISDPGLGLLSCEILGDLLGPRLVRLCGVHFELEPP